MMRFIRYLFAMAIALVLTRSVDAAPKAPQAPKAVPSTIEVDGKLVGTVKLNLNGVTKLPRLESGLKVSVELKNGQALSARATDSQGQALQVSVRNDSVRRVIIIIIITRGGTVVIVLR
jgi:hypothetical protein